MAIKLIKACKELNIGMSTAVEFCKKQGKEIATDPNTRIEDDLYLLLAKEFNKDMALKLEAERQAQERHEREIPKSVAVEKPVVEHIPTEVPKPKVVGTIELDADKKRKAEEEAARKAAEEAKKAEEARLAAEAKAKAEAEAAARQAAEEAQKRAEEAAKATEPVEQPAADKQEEEEIFRLGKDRKSTRLNSSHIATSRMPSSA